MNRATRQPLPGARWFFQHGPIDCVIGADGEPCAVAQALEAAWARFQSVLTELVAELGLLRMNLAAVPGHSVAASGPVARRMVAACRPYAAQGQFITAMAAVAGSVAMELIGHFERPGVRRAYVNNGGDIALHLAPGEQFEIGIAGIDDATMRGQLTIHADDNVRGVATSGWRGRSFSLGIADSVTVLARSAAEADAAATMIANAVNVDRPGIVRIPACDLSAESDLGSLLVTRGVPTLDKDSIERALDAGVSVAKKYLNFGLIERAALRLQGQARSIGNDSASAFSKNCHSERSEV